MSEAEHSDAPESAAARPEEPDAAGTGAEPARAAEEPEDALASDESIDPRSSAEILGNISVGGAVGSGFHVAGHGATINLGMPAAEPGPKALSWSFELAADVSRMASAYAPTRCDDDLDRRLRGGNLLYLSGPVGSGRFTAACMALLRRYTGDKVAGLAVPPGHQVSEIFDRPEHLWKGFGHVLVAATDLRLDPMTLARLEKVASGREATVIVVADGGSRPDLADYLLRYRGPDLAAVFRVQLQRRLLNEQDSCLGGCPDCEGACVTRYVDECVRLADLDVQLGGGASLAHVIHWVEEIVAAKAAAGDDLADLLARLLPTRLREEARQILAVEPGPIADGQSFESRTAYRRAFRISYAAFNGASLAQVFEAADRLAHQSSNSNGTDTPQPPFGMNVRELLGTVMEAHVEDVDQPPVGQPRTANLANRHLVRVLLDLAWHDWGLSGRLLRWLDELVASGRPEARVRAAAVAGQLAGFDFGQVYGDLVDKWARHQRREYRQAAGWAALSTAWCAPALLPTVGVQLREWTQRGTAYQRDAAARGYAQGLGALLPYEALNDLRVIASDGLQRRNGVVADAVAVTCPAAPPWYVVTALGRWLESRYGFVHAHGARALVRLARRRADSKREGWPEPLAWIADGDVEPADLAALWAPALSLPVTAFEAWGLLGYWISRADTRPELADPLARLLAEVCADPALRGRTSHQLTHVWRPQMPVNPFLDRVATLLKEA
jgi:hypothetical protein